MLGSIAFMASAIGAFVIPRTDSAVDLTIADRGTLVGAVCFFVGALLAIPAWRQAGEAAATAEAAARPPHPPSPGRQSPASEIASTGHSSAASAQHPASAHLSAMT